VAGFQVIFSGRFWVITEGELADAPHRRAVAAELDQDRTGVGTDRAPAVAGPP
jgi:hypothetical protein